MAKGKTRKPKTPPLEKHEPQGQFGDDYVVTPGGPHPLPVTDRWKLAVERRLEQLKMTRADLARAVNSSKAAITQLLTTARQSFLVEPVNKALGWVANERDCYADEAAVFGAKVPPGEVPRTAPWNRHDRWEYLAKKFKADPFADPEELTPILADLNAREAVELIEHLHAALRKEQENADHAARDEEMARRALEMAQFSRQKAERAVASRRRTLDAIAEITRAIAAGDKRWFY